MARKWMAKSEEKNTNFSKKILSQNDEITTLGPIELYHAVWYMQSHFPFPK